MPTWTPGSYLVREFSRNVLDLIAFDIEDDTKLVSKKTSKNVWEVSTGGATNVRVKYRVYALEFTVDTSYLDNMHAVINGASVFMYVDGLQLEEFVLTIFPNSDWKVISTGLETPKRKVMVPNRSEFRILTSWLILRLKSETNKCIPLRQRGKT